MKKSRLFSALTSIALTAGLVISSIPFNVSAAVQYQETEMAMKLVPNDSTISMTDVAAGTAKTTVKLCVENIPAVDMINVISTKLVASDSAIKLSNLHFVENLELAPNNVPAAIEKAQADYEAETNEKKKEALKKKLDAYKTVDGRNCMGSATNPALSNFTLSCSSAYPFTIYEPDKGNGIVEVDVEFPSTMKAGTYTIGLSTADTVIQSGMKSGDGTLITDFSASAIKNVTPAQITLGDAVTPPDPTKAEETDPFKYTGEAKVYGDVKTAAPGETVTMEIYVDPGNGPEVMDGLQIGVIPDFEESSVEGFTVSEGLGIDGGSITLLPSNPEVAKGWAYLLANASDGSSGTLDPELSIIEISFTIPETAKAGTEYNFEITGTAGMSVPVIWKTGSTYYKPVITNGKITVAGEVPTQGDATDPFKYTGEAKVYGDVKTAKAGETVTMEFYVDPGNGPEVMDGLQIGIIPDFEESSVEGFSASEGLGIDGGSITLLKSNPDVAKGWAYLLANASDGSSGTLDPELSIIEMTFTIPKGTKAGTVYNFEITGTAGMNVPVIWKTGSIYYKPVVTDGKITVVADDDPTDPTDAPTDPTDPPKTEI
ncbi:MAG: hypothetical protein NC320_08650, partial [Clostridium sp.]|nr:hypothetical protein [Clostridium sp.]